MPTQRKHIRKTISDDHQFVPEWEGAIEGYAFSYCRRWLPMLAPVYDMEDLKQEAYIVYLICARHYAHKVDNAAWFMSLYQTSIKNHLAKLLHKKKMQPEASLTLEDIPYGDIISDTENLGLLLKQIDTAPKEVKAVITAIAQMPPTKRGENVSQSDTFSNRELCELIGRPSKGINLVSFLTTHLKLD